MKNKKIKLLTEILAIVAIALISFVGVYKQEGNIIKNQVKEFNFGSNLDGYREVILEPADIEEVEESEDDLEELENETNQNTEETETNKIEYSEEDYKKSKELIEKRLKLLNVEDYIISQDLSNGNIYLYLQENTETDHIISNITQVGKFEIKDSEDSSEVFVNNENLKKVSTAYNSAEDGTIVFLQFELDKDGTKALKDLSAGEYKTKDETETNTEESEDENNSLEENENIENNEIEEENTETQKKIVMSIDDSTLISTSFDNPIENGIINLSMNRASKDEDKIKETVKSASTIMSMLNSGAMPVSYEVTNNTFIQSNITKDKLTKICIAIGIMVIVGMVILIIKHKSKGVLAAISYIGFIAVDLLIIKYTNVSIYIESFVGGIIVLIINYLMICNLLKLYDNNNEVEVKSLLAKEIIRYIPIVIIAIAFVFTKWGELSALGMFIFWGLIVSFIYNYSLTRDMIKKETNKRI